MPEEVKKSLIGDLAGLSEPLKKLVEVVSSGVGRFTDAMWFAKRDADNEAYKILKVGGAQTQVAVDRMKQVAALGSGSTPKMQKLTLAGNEVNAELSDGQQEILALKERGDNRTEYQNLLHQLNTEQVVGFAAEELAQENTTVSEEPVNQNWSARYFDTIKNVSGEDLQILWGKVLAGEVKNPGSFSLRTLEVLKNLSQEEALLFERACNYLMIAVVNGHKDYTLVKTIGEKNIGLYQAITYQQSVLLNDCGLFSSVRDSGFVLSMGGNENIKTGYQIGSKMLFVEGKYTNPHNPFVFPCYLLTSAGQEISSLISLKKPEPAFFKAIGNAFAEKGFSVTYADFAGWTEDGNVMISGEKHSIESYNE